MSIYTEAQAVEDDTVMDEQVQGPSRLAFYRVAKDG
jgi:hypothetical protein